MAKLTLNRINSFVSGMLSTLNVNWGRIEQALENTLSRDGSTPNAMNANIDMNNHRIINVAEPSSDNDVVRKIDLEQAVASFAGDGGNVLFDSDIAVSYENDPDKVASASSVYELDSRVDTILSNNGVPPTVNNLTTVVPGSNLDAVQGTVLKTLVDGLSGTVTALDATIDTRIDGVDASILALDARLTPIETIFVTVNVTGIGAGGNITTRINDGFNTLIARGGGTLILPVGAWQVSTGTLVVPSNVTVRGLFPGATTLTFPASTGLRRGMFFTGDGKSNIRFEDFNVVGTWCDDALIISGNNCRNIQVRDINCTNAQLITAGGGAWDDFPTAGYGYGLVIERCTGVGNNLWTSQGQFIYIQFQYNWVIRDCKGVGYNHGVQWWGGDAAFSTIKPQGRGEPTYARKCGRGLIDNCEFVSINGAAIWGSMGEGITVRDCYGQDCGDIVFDSEGGFDVEFNNCTGVNGKFAIFATFFAARECRFINCRGVFTSNVIAAGGNLRFYNSWNSSNDPTMQKDVILDGCTFESTVLSAGGLLPYVAQDLGPVYDIVVRNCKFRNGCVNLINSGNSKSMIVQNNIFEFDMAPTAAQHVIVVGRPQYTSPGTSDGDYITIASNNRIRIRSAAWPTGSAGISFNYNVAGATWTWSPECKNNEIKTTGAILTYGYYIYSRQGSTASRIRLHFGGNSAPDSYAGGGTARTSALVIDETGASTRPVQVIPHGFNKSSENGVDFGPTLTRSLNMVKTPTAITGTNTIAIADTSNLQVGDIIRMTGCTNAGNNNTNFRIASIVANTSVTVTSADGLSTTPLTNETPPGAARLYKRILSKTTQLCTTISVGSSTTDYGEANTGFQALSNFRYYANISDTGGTTLLSHEQLRWVVDCYVHGTLTVYLQNLTDTDLNCADVTLYISGEGRIQ